MSISASAATFLSTMAAQTEPVKSPAQQLAETTWSNYAGLLCKGDAGILSLYVRSRCGHVHARERQLARWRPLLLARWRRLPMLWHVQMVKLLRGRQASPPCCRRRCVARSSVARGAFR